MLGEFREGPVDIPGLGRGDGLPAKLIRSDGTCQRVMVCYFDGGLRLEGAEAIVAGERLLLQLPDNLAYEILVRWVVGDQVRAVVLG